MVCVLWVYKFSYTVYRESNRFYSYFKEKGNSKFKHFAHLYFTSRIEYFVKTDVKNKQNITFINNS